VTNPTVELFYPTDLEKDTVLIELEGIVTAENSEYLFQNETYGKRIYAQEQLGLMLTLDIQAYVERTFSASMPGKTLFKVMSGPYKTKSEVNNAREVMVKNNRQPLLIKKCIKA
jgi:cobalamin biosynthesis protein CbiD